MSSSFVLLSKVPVESVTQISQSRVAEYLRALGGEFSGTIPETFLAVLAVSAWQQLFKSAELGIALARTLHVSQDIKVVSALQIGDEISSTLQVTQLRARGEKTVLSCRVEIYAGRQLRGVVDSTFWCMQEVV
ncbi:MAG: FAS1-like dehydratase domain-containing protein [Propionibacteriaceae bacterium]